MQECIQQNLNPGLYPPVRFINKRGNKPIIFPPARAAILEDLRCFPGVECLWVAKTNIWGQIWDVGLAVVGTATEVEFSAILLTVDWLLIHNHPYGVIHLSEKDFEIAELGRKNGCGTYVTNNALTEWVIVARPRNTVECELSI